MLVNIFGGALQLIYTQTVVCVFLYYPSKYSYFTIYTTHFLMCLLSGYPCYTAYYNLRRHNNQNGNYIALDSFIFVFIEILFKILLFKGGVLIYAEHCTHQRPFLRINSTSFCFYLPYYLYAYSWYRIGNRLFPCYVSEFNVWPNSEVYFFPGVIKISYMVFTPQITSSKQKKRNKMVVSRSNNFRAALASQATAIEENKNPNRWLFPHCNL